MTAARDRRPGLSAVDPHPSPSPTPACRCRAFSCCRRWPHLAHGRRCQRRWHCSCRRPTAERQLTATRTALAMLADRAIRGWPTSRRSRSTGRCRSSSPSRWGSPDVASHLEQTPAWVSSVSPDTSAGRQFPAARRPRRYRLLTDPTNIGAVIVGRRTVLRGTWRRWPTDRRRPGTAPRNQQDRGAENRARNVVRSSAASTTAASFGGGHAAFRQGEIAMN